MKALKILFFILIPSAVFAQEEKQVTHLKGTKRVGGIQVTVSSTGTVNENSSYCKSTGPYHAGKNGIGEGDGSYIFEFKPAISNIRLNFSAMSSSESYHEIIQLFVNDEHYRLTEAGTSNGCESLSVLTEEGDIAPCEGCSGSGWNGTEIQGEISKLEVRNVVIKGSPEGTVFSLFINGEIEEVSPGPELISVRALRLMPLPNEPNHITFVGIPDSGAKIRVYDDEGKELKEMSQRVQNFQRVDVSALPRGYYVFWVEGERFKEKRSLNYLISSVDDLQDHVHGHVKSHLQSPP